MCERSYLCIDLKSFYASVECVERGLDPLSTNLLVADESRTEKTICLAVSPSLKACGISGRARLFEAVEKVRLANVQRRSNAPGGQLQGTSWDAGELASTPGLALGYITAPPRMALYMEYSARIYEIYLRFVAPEDIFAYSVDEVFMDISNYLTAGQKGKDFARTVLNAVHNHTGITATAGIGSNMYLAKIAMDIVAKHAPADENGVRMAQLDEMSYRRLLWEHRPITDFWRVGPGYAKKLKDNGMFTMGDIALCSVSDAALLYRLFGVNAELLIDHAWGWEPCTIKDVKEYKPSENSLSTGQVLPCAYDFKKGRIIVREMADSLVLELLSKGLMTDRITLTVGYDILCLTDPTISAGYSGPVTTDRYGRSTPKPAHGSIQLEGHSSSTGQIVSSAVKLYDSIVDPALLLRRMYVVAENVLGEGKKAATAETAEPVTEQLDMFADNDQLERQRREKEARLQRERRRQEAVLGMQKRYGKNALLKGTNLQEGATARERNDKIGGHKAK